MLSKPSSSLKLLVTHEPPGVFDNCRKFPIMETSKNCPFPGWILEVTTMIGYYLNVTIEPIVGLTSDFGGGVGNLVKIGILFLHLKIVF